MCCGDRMQGHHAGRMGHEGHHRGMMHGMHGCSCCCGDRRFLSRREKIEMLEEYRDSLKNELEGVEEELKEIKIAP